MEISLKFILELRFELYTQKFVFSSWRCALCILQQKRHLTLIPLDLL